MKAIALTNEGIEDISEKEIIELTSSKTEKRKGGVVFETELEQIFSLCYRAQSLRKVLIVLKELKNNDLSLKDADLDWLKAKSFVVEGEGENKTEFIEKIIDVLKTKEWKLDYKNPEVRFYCVVEVDKVYFCVDISEEDLSRREYRIFLKAESYKGNMAYALVRLAEFSDKDFLLDVFCRDGIVGIETALYLLGKSPHYYNKEKFYFRKMKAFEAYDFEGLFEKIDKKIKEDELKIILLDANFANVQAAKKNAKIAGVLDKIRFSRESIEWLDTKFDKKSVDVIIGFPIQVSSIMEEKTVEKLYKQLFYQADFLLKKDGKIVLGLKRGIELLKKKADEQKFKVLHERIIKQGKEDLRILVFGRE